VTRRVLAKFRFAASAAETMPSSEAGNSPTSAHARGGEPCGPQ
jgi:hypothetical protein